MTQKSYGRQMRDAKKRDAVTAFKTSTQDSAVWDEVNELYENCIQFINKHSELSVLSQDLKLMAAIENTQMFSDMVKILRNDLMSLGNELKQIHDLHVGKVGRAVTQDEHMEAVNVYQYYMGFWEKMQTSVKPNFYRITEALQRAECIAYPERAAAFKAAIENKKVEEANAIAHVDKQVADYIAGTNPSLQQAQDVPTVTPPSTEQ